jgi:hypothetical protein
MQITHSSLQLFTDIIRSCRHLHLKFDQLLARYRNLLFASIPKASKKGLHFGMGSSV